MKKQKNSHLPSEKFALSRNRSPPLALSPFRRPFFENLFFEPISQGFVVDYLPGITKLIYFYFFIFILARDIS